jgi:hypothetical protein
MTLNSTGLGVGVTPTQRLHIKLDQNAYTYARVENQNASSGAFAGLMLAASGNTWGIANGSTAANSNSLAFYNDAGGTNSVKMLIDSSGNVGVGVTPSAWNSNYNAIDIGQNGTIAGRVGSSNTVDIASNGFRNTSGNWVYKLSGSNTACRYQQDGSTGIHYWFTGAAGTAGNTITGFSTPIMTLDASGNLLVGTTSTSNTTQGFKILSTGRFYGVMATGGYAIMNHTGGSGTEYIYEFQRAGTAVGSITTTTTSTAYVTSSDYRLKETVQPLSGGLARVNALKPSIYKWKSDGSSGEGFLAHELAEVVPSAVTGEKDAVNEDGSIKAQGVDLSKVVPILVAAIKELTARVEALEA